MAVLYIRVPDQLKAAVDAYADARALSLTQGAVELLSTALELPDERRQVADALRAAREAFGR